ncbi:hypothetical protein BH23GEM6_BH23GEM6_18640 [soil metagenome]
MFFEPFKVAVGVSLVLLSSCGTAPEQPLVHESQAAEVATIGAGEPLGIRDLEGFLPTALPGLRRVETGGDRGSVLGMSTSRATALYTPVPGGEEVPQRDSTLQIRVRLTDLGPLRGRETIEQDGWIPTSVDRESSSGSERTFMLSGYPAHEIYSTSSGPSYGEIQVIVARRFVVEVSGRGAELELLHETIGSLDLRRLELLAPTPE